MGFTYRSQEKELLDAENIPKEDLFQNLKELDVINRHLGGYRASKKCFTKLLDKKKVPIRVLDIGFGGGDFIKQLAMCAKQSECEIFFYGVDLKMECVEYATTNLTFIQNKALICKDYRHLSDDFLKKIDIIHSSLFLHHLSNEEILDLLIFAKKHQCIILANDLQRHWLAYYSIKCLTMMFSSSHLVKNDAALSVQRAFRKSELVSILQEAGFRKYDVTWHWAFRYMITAIE